MRSSSGDRLSAIKKSVAEFFYAQFCQYETPREMHIQSTKVGVLGRLVQLSIITYIIVYVMIWQKGYQKFGGVESVVVTKVKGVSYSKPFARTHKHEHRKSDHLYHRIWDVADYVIPPAEHGAVFIMTSQMITPNQTQGTCDEAVDTPGAICDPKNNTCVKGTPFMVGNGVATGRCILSSHNTSVHVCEIHAWCPVESPFPTISNYAILEETTEFTLMIKNNIFFPVFGPSYKHQNTLNSNDKRYLQTCRYHPQDHPYCPVFKLGDIISAAEEDYSEIALHGALISLTITWDCNLDWDMQKYCLPKYTFSRLDKPASTPSPGFNFRYADYHEVHRRTLHKVIGIKLAINVQGTGGKFCIATMLLNIGSSIALLGLTSVLCDMVILHLLKDSPYYRKHKYLMLQNSDTLDQTSTEIETGNERAHVNSQNSTP